MKKYWFLLDTYVFIWFDKNEILVYNTLSGKSNLIKNNELLDPISKKLCDPSNLYVVELTDNDLKHKSVYDFVHKIRNNFSGDLFDQIVFPEKPIVIISQINLNDDVERDRSDFKNVEFFGQKVLNNLLEIEIYLGGECHYNCQCCDEFWKQTSWCQNLSDKMSEKTLLALLQQIKNVNIKRITFVSTETNLNSVLKKHIDDLRSLCCAKNLSLHSKSLYNNNLVETDLFDELFTELTVFVDDFSDIDNHVLNQLKDKPTIFVFKIESEHDFESAISLVSKLNINAKFIPFYSGNNLNFFELYIYQDKKSILSTKWSKKDIFSHQHINANSFGRLILLPNGDVYSDLNLSSLGNISTDSLSSLVYKELESKQSWRLTRDCIQPCNNCLYRYLCPPVSNYEKTANKFDFCHLY